MERHEGCIGGCLSAIPFVGWLYEVGVKPVTFYKLDSALMFQSVMHDMVLLPVVETFTSAQGLPSIRELAQRPTMREMLR
jgi:hypothetical protein